MEKETNLSKSDDPELELGSEPGKKDVSKPENLETGEAAPENPSEAEFFQKLTGREDIKSPEDFTKHYEGLKKLVGDQEVATMRKKAEEYDSLKKELGERADEFLGSEEGKEFLKDFVGKRIEERVSRLEGESKQERFLKAHPEAEPILDLVTARADKDEISLEEAYTRATEGKGFSIQDLVNSKLEAEKTKAEEKSIGVDSKSRMTPGESAELGQLIEGVEKSDTFEAKQKLVEKTLKLPE